MSNDFPAPSLKIGSLYTAAYKDFNIFILCNPENESEYKIFKKHRNEYPIVLYLGTIKTRMLDLHNQESNAFMFLYNNKVYISYDWVEEYVEIEDKLCLKPNQ